MTTTESLGPRPAPAAFRRLRRSRTERVGAGVAGGLGEYFGLDPVLFRVLFATAAFFGGAGILAYLLAWAAIPEQGTERAAVDGWIRELRRRRVPFWVLAVLAGLFLWVIAFSWWAPGPFFPVLAVVVLLAVAVTRSSRRHARAESASAPVSLEKAPPRDPADAAAADATPDWLRETREWIAETKQASRGRKRRALPVKIATLVVLGTTLVVLAFVDGAKGIPIPTYFWATLGIVVVGLLAGLGLRRTPWSLTGLLVLAVAGVVAFGGSHAELHNGMGDRTWRPTTTVGSHYALAFGQGTLDLRKLPAPTAATAVRIDLAAGQVRILAPKTLALTVEANVHIGNVTVDGENVQHANGGFNYNRIVDPPAGATGPALTVRVHVADGNIDVERF